MSDTLLQPPSLNHWFGTDLAGNDLFYSSIVATGVELFTVAVVAVMLHLLALVGVGLFGISTNRWWRVALPQATHFWSSLPHLLLVTLLVVLVGPGQVQIMMALVVALLSAHVLYGLSLFWEAERQDFVTAKFAIGLSHTYVLRRDVLALVHHRLLPYTRARLPEIVMLHLALSFLGFGIRQPGISLGRLLFDGLPFMFSAWWLWVFPAIIAGGVILAATSFAARIDG